MASYMTMFLISIPYGTIKSKNSLNCSYTNLLFQFHMVRLKVKFTSHVERVLLSFQFHMVRLKAVKIKKNKA